MAAIAAAKIIKFQIAKSPTREKAGHYEVWSDFAKLYSAALDDLIDKVVTKHLKKFGITY